jgi:hypothetical protein
MESINNSSLKSKIAFALAGPSRGLGGPWTPAISEIFTYNNNNNNNNNNNGCYIHALPK